MLDSIGELRLMKVLILLGKVLVALTLVDTELTVTLLVHGHCGRVVALEKL